MPGQYLVSPRHRIASDDGPGVGGVPAGQGGLPGCRFQFHSRLLERVRQLRGQGVGYQFGPVGQHILRRDNIRRHNVLAHGYPDQGGGALGTITGYEDHLSDQVDARGAAHGLDQLGRVDRQAPDISRPQGIIDRLQIGGGQHQGLVSQGGLDGQRRSDAGGSHRSALIQQRDAQGNLVAAHQGQVGGRDAAGEHDGHGGQINQQLHNRYQ